MVQRRDGEVWWCLCATGTGRLGEGCQNTLLSKHARRSASACQPSAVRDLPIFSRSCPRWKQAIGTWKGQVRLCRRPFSGCSRASSNHEWPTPSRTLWKAPYAHALMTPWVSLPFNMLYPVKLMTPLRILHVLSCVWLAMLERLFKRSDSTAPVAVLPEWLAEASESACTARCIRDASRCSVGSMHVMRNSTCATLTIRFPMRPVTVQRSCEALGTDRCLDYGFAQCAPMSDRSVHCATACARHRFSQVVLYLVFCLLEFRW